MTKMEVRCCCDPFKLLGWLEIPPGHREYIFPVAQDRTVEAVILEVARIELGGRQYWALKNRDYPMETLRKMHGFQENVG